MFERICVPPIQPEETKFDLGLLAESLIFYNSVFLVIRHTNLLSLLRGVGPETLIELLENHGLGIRFLHRNLGALTFAKGTSDERHTVGFFHAPKYDLESVAAKAFIEATGKDGRGRRLALRFCRSVSEIQYSDTVADSIRDDMKNGKCIEGFIRRRLESLGISQDEMLPKDFKYHFTPQENNILKLVTNCDLEKLGRITRELADPASVIAEYGTTVANMTLWAQLDSEVAIYPRQSDVIESRLKGSLEMYSGKQSLKSVFQEFVFDDAKAISGAINTDQKNFDDLVRVLKKARKFKEWLKDQPVNADLVREYHKKVVEDSWIEKLPGKSVRWLFFVAAGLGVDALLGTEVVGKSTGAALGALDTFFVDRLIKGWRPNQFVEGDLKKFLNPNKKV